MQDEKWFELVDSIKEKFGILSQETEPIAVFDNAGSEQEIGEVEIVIFKNQMGKMKLERRITPLVIGRDDRYHKHSGVGVTKLQYSATEKVQRVEAFVWDEDKEDWKKIDTKGMFQV